MADNKRIIGYSLALVGASTNLIASLILFILIGQAANKATGSFYFDINTFLSIILSITSMIVFIYYLVKKEEKANLVAIILALFCSAFAYYLYYFSTQTGLGAGSLIIIGLFASLYGVVLLHISYFSKETYIELPTHKEVTPIERKVEKNISPESAVERIEKLKKLKEENIITEEEFEKKKTEIILKM